VSEEDVEEGWVATALAEEHPGLRLRSIVVAGVAGGRSPEALRHRLRVLSSRFAGAEAVLLRSRPVPHAYRVFFRAVGLDPDVARTPIEQAAVDRLVHGGFRSEGAVPDALLIGLLETGVPLWALDDAALDGPLGVREAEAGETLGTGAYADGLPAGRLVVADAARPVAVLFGAIARSHAASPDGGRLRVFAVQVDGVPELHLEEALWSCAEALVSA
jgi:DNA/RNA-binding domain of Phe-tRNA-synthetase-like protein